MFEFDNIEPTFVSLVLALLPQLERLCISQSNQATRDEPEPLELNDYVYPRPGITYLKILSSLPASLDGLSVFPNLRTLDISTKLAGLSQRAISRNSELYASTTTISAFKKIRHLRLDFQVKTVGIWDLGARACLTSILQATHDLESLDFYAEPSDSKNPFRSVRAFPHYQANIQNYPDVSSPLDPNVEDQPYWDERIYDARTDITDYQNLVDAIVHLRPSLETLRLPGGFWALPGGMRKPLPRFDGFVQLKTLILPQAAIISIKLDNMRFADVSGDFDLSPITVLPSSLQNLKIFDADISLLASSWLWELFITQKNCNQWPELQRLEILFGPYGYYGEVEMLLSRQSQQVFWTWVDEATFEVFVGKDDEVPSVSL
ncbi:hypothetical protein N0V83_001155 [Neocucurbitaria cava]|uniref:F-box domain-containing protein n=1 Tax=Neocucurbitaria cava TaxID=798079 RepID=A0A9W9CQ47_9PLEO|nr:hypothetical protein N0V83_001155 [Neocucurbitaria cava]